MKPPIAIPSIVALLHRAYSRKSLTPLGLFAAGLTASIHALHPSSTPFLLLAVFYLSGTKATKVKHDIKKGYTVSATGSEGGETSRTHVQVLANSIVASLLVLVDLFLFNPEGRCFGVSRRENVALVGIVANYASVAADTLSSELGILSISPPRLITSPSLRVVPRGTNGGVTPAGIVAGFSGAFIVAFASGVALPFCGGWEDRAWWVAGMTVWGGLGSLADSVLGGLFQASVVDKRSGKIVEGTGGMKVLIHPGSTRPGSRGGDVSLEDKVQLRNTEAVVNTATLRGSRATGEAKGSQPGRAEGHESRRVESGCDILDNNAVNVLMAGMMSLGAMGIAWFW